MERTEYPNKRKVTLGLPDIGIPSEVLFHPNLTCTEKILFGFLRNLAQGKDGCWASNRYLGDLLGVGAQTVSNAINNLKKYKFIRIYNEQKGQKTIRRIFINPEYPVIYYDLMEEIQTQLKNGSFKLKNNSDVLGGDHNGLSENVNPDGTIDSNDPYKKNYIPPIKKFIPPYKKIYTKYDNEYDNINKNNIRQNKKSNKITWSQLCKKYGPSQVRFVKRFLEQQKENFPKFIKEDITPDCNRVLSSLDCLDKLQRLDGFDFETEIKPTLEAALQDEFWARNILSLGSLRKKGKNGEKKFVNIQVTLPTRNRNFPVQPIKPCASPDNIIAEQGWDDFRVKLLKERVFDPVLTKLNGASDKTEVTKSICRLIKDIEKRQKRPQPPKNKEEYKREKFIHDIWESIPKANRIVTDFTKWLEDQDWIGILKPGHFDIDGKTFATFRNEYQDRIGGFDIFEGRMLP